jgi:hypothetical protein
LVRRKGLCHVVVSPERQSADAIFLQAACRQDDHRDAGGTIGERPADFEPVGAVRQHQVEQQQIRREPLDRRERLVAVVARFDHEPFVLQIVAQQSRDCLVVFDDQHAFGHLHT